MLRKDYRSTERKRPAQTIVDGLMSSALGAVVLALLFPILSLPRAAIALFHGESAARVETTHAPSFGGALARQAAVVLVACVVFGLILGNVLVALRR